MRRGRFNRSAVGGGQLAREIGHSILFGNYLPSADTVGNPNRWAALEWDTTTGLIHDGARFYDPVTGRHLTPDSTMGDPYGFTNINDAEAFMQTLSPTPAPSSSTSASAPTVESSSCTTQQLLGGYCPSETGGGGGTSSPASSTASSSCPGKVAAGVALLLTLAFLVAIIVAAIVMSDGTLLAIMESVHALGWLMVGIIILATLGIGLIEQGLHNPC